MTELVLHAKTKEQVKDFLNSPSHSLIIVGQSGSGKTTLMRYIAAQILDADEVSLMSHPYVFIVEPASSSISIDEIRELQNAVKLKTLGTAAIRRVLMIDDADKLTLEAQNALLKLLEEPPIDTLIMLASSHVQALLPTIRSRAQNINLQNPSRSTTSDYFKKLGFTADKISRAHSISGGKIGLMAGLLNENEPNQLSTQIDLAKRLLIMTAFERLTKVDELSKQKDLLPDLLNAFEIICDTGMKQSLMKDNTLAAKNWHSRLKLVSSSQDKLTKNANSKLLMSDLMLNL